MELPSPVIEEGARLVEGFMDLVSQIGKEEKAIGANRLVEEAEKLWAGGFTSREVFEPAKLMDLGGATPGSVQELVHSANGAEGFAAESGIFPSGQTRITKLGGAFQLEEFAQGHTIPRFNMKVDRVLSRDQSYVFLENHSGLTPAGQTRITFLPNGFHINEFPNGYTPPRTSGLNVSRAIAKDYGANMIWENPAGMDTAGHIRIGHLDDGYMVEQFKPGSWLQSRLPDKIPTVLSRNGSKLADYLVDATTGAVQRA